ncbi:hypothetical protein HOLleu_39202 [Holothuria leucospilota]|uniref:TNFR-Cys domain-containing protein n=1 Tax=Holothuria leucospilota TaxID=206669 RepID=A0A9Q0YH00_HOLLE|nr:hypothetical protein HOLleu_39202 [Holothuria leucospilota]
MKGTWEKDCILLMLFIIFFLLEAQANYDERCENPGTPSPTCGSGKFKDPNGECQVCPDDQFQDAVNHICGQCKNCTKCGDGEISKDHPVLCLTYKDSTCLKVNASTTPKSDGTTTSSTSEGPFSSSSSPNTTTLEEILARTTQVSANDVTTPGSEYIQEEKHPYKIPFFVVLVLLVLVVIVLGGIIWWQRKKLKNGQHLAGNQLGQNGSGAGQNGSGAGQNGSGTGQNGSETEMTNMLANGHV